MNGGTIVLAADGLSVGYRAHGREARQRRPRVDRESSLVVLSDVTLTLAAGEVCCLIGTNGSGKSTLLRTVAGMQLPLRGDATVNGRRVHQLSARERAALVSVVLTERIDAGFLDVYTLVAMGRYPYTGWTGSLRDRDRRIVQSALNDLGIAHLARRSLSRLSDGERQKAMIGRAIAQETPIIILDEPTAFLDVPGRADMLQLLRALARRTGKCVLLSTHDLDLALRGADRMLLITADRTLLSGAPEDLVLQGAFSRAFRDQNVEFDSERAQFILRDPRRGAVALRGESGSARYRWTVRALERSGYSVVPAAPDGREADGRELSQPFASVDLTLVDDAPRWSVTATAGSERGEPGKGKVEVPGGDVVSSIYELIRRLADLESGGPVAPRGEVSP